MSAYSSNQKVYLLYESHEHCILLQKGANPVSVHPYRYLQIQKEEMVEDVLKAEIIKILVQLVKKKDGSWR